MSKSNWGTLKDQLLNSQKPLIKKPAFAEAYLTEDLLN
jgi:hypothetical protein